MRGVVTPTPVPWTPPWTPAISTASARGSARAAPGDDRQTGDARDAAAGRARTRRQARARERPLALQSHTIHSGRRGDAAHRVRSRRRGASRHGQRRSRGRREDRAARCHHAELVRESLDAIGYVSRRRSEGKRDWAIVKKGFCFFFQKLPTRSALRCELEKAVSFGGHLADSLSRRCFGLLASRRSERTTARALGERPSPFGASFEVVSRAHSTIACVRRRRRS